MKSWILFLALAFHLVFGDGSFGQTRVGKSKTSDKEPYAFDDITQQRFTGDLDEMIQKRFIRVLVTYSKTHYFVDGATQRGLTYELFRLFEDNLNRKLKKKHVRIHVVFVPVARDEILPGLIEGRGDIASANLAITRERLKQADFTNPTLDNVSEIVVTKPGVESISSPEDLSGKEVYIQKSSSYYESIKRLNVDLTKAGKRPVRVRFTSEELEIEDILEMVNAGLVHVTIVDKHIAEFWKQIFNKILLHTNAEVRSGGKIGVMIRKNSPQLKGELNEFFFDYPHGSKIRNILLQKYLKSTKFARNATSRDEITRFEATVEFFRKYGGKYDLDYLLMIAQGYQESGLNQDARNPSGAVGVMQVLPSTGRDMNVGDITKLENNIHAGVKYIRFMMNHFYADEPMDPLNKGLFTFASFNAGPGRISQLRKQAAERGLDANRWFNHVEVVAAEKIGRETVQYVSNIYKYYLAYKMVMEQREEREKAKLEEKKEAGN